MFPEDYISNQTEISKISEWIREKVLLETKEEIPHSVAVIIDNISENSKYNSLDVNASIIVERASQKKILIGKNGQKLKSIGTKARLDLNKTLKKKIKKTSKKAYWEYVENTITEENSHNKKLWTFIKHRKTDSIDIAPLKENGILKDTPKEKAEILNNQFSSVFTTDNPADFPDLSRWQQDPECPEIAAIKIIVDGVTKLLTNLNQHKAMGPDGLHPKVLKQLAPSIAPSLQLIFQKSLNTGEVPADWKEANVSPIFKKGERYHPANYRPVSLTCICSKILEHIVTKHLVSHLERHSILYRRPATWIQEQEINRDTTCSLHTRHPEQPARWSSD